MTRQFLTDVRYAFRTLAKQPGVLVVAAASIALGVGANLTIFSLANTLLLSVPTADRPEQLVHIRMNSGSHVSHATWRQLNESGALAAIAGYDFEGSVNWRSGDQSITITPLMVTANFFDTLRIPIAIGRGFTAAEAHADLRPHLVVVSHGFWKTHLLGDPSIVGRALWINGEAYTVTGVLPERYRSIAGFGLAPDVYVPLSRDLLPWLEQTATASQLVGRLHPGQRLEEGRAALDVIAARIGTEPNPEFTAVRTFVAAGTLQQIQMRELESVGAFFLLLLVVSGLVLAIACANVAGLLLARSLAKRREIALRVALGASRGRLVRQMLTESLMLTTIGAVAGAALSAFAIVALSRVSLPLTLPVDLQLALDSRTVSLAFGLIAISTCVTGLAPALQATRPSLLPALASDDRATTASRLSIRSLLVAGQVAVSVVLLVGALLFLRSLATGIAVSPGFDVDSVLVARLTFVEGRQGSPNRQAVEEIVQRVRGIPGVVSAAFADGVPLTMSSGSRTGASVRIDGHDTRVHVEYSSNEVGPDYFKTMGITLLQGRDFTIADRRGAPPSIVINEEFARRYFQGMNPIGRHIADPRGRGPDRLVVGVVSNSKYRSLSEDREAAIYEPFLQGGPERQTHVLIRTAGTPETLVPAVRSAVLAVDGSTAVTLTPMRSALEFALFPSQIGSMLLGLMGGIGTFLAMVGLFGVMSFAVSRRTQEIAIRMTLGASRHAVLRLVLRDAGRVVLAGTIVGLLLAWIVTMPLSAFLVSDVRPGDPWSFIGAAIVLALASIAAIWGPAMRAIGTEPWKALRM